MEKSKKDKKKKNDEILTKLKTNILNADVRRNSLQIPIVEIAGSRHADVSETVHLLGTRG